MCESKGAHCTYTEHLMHEILDLMQGFTDNQVINNIVYISIHIVYISIHIVYIHYTAFFTIL